MKNEKKKSGCCSCEKNFKDQVQKTVDEVENYTAEDHKKKEAEVDAAFARQQKK